MVLLLGTVAAVSLAAVAYVVKRRATRALRQLEPGRAVIAANLARSRRR